MVRTWHKLTRMSTVTLSSLLILLLIAACGGGGGGEALNPTEPVPGEGEAGEEQGQAPEEATGVPEIECQEGQQELVWMVRNGPEENPWEANVVRPAFMEENPEICLRILSVVQEDIAVRREAMIAAGEPLHVWSSNWGGDG